MADTLTEPRETADDTPRPDQPDEAPITLGDFFRRLYAVTYSKGVGLAIILVFALLVLLGVVFEQAPAGTWDDPVARESFLTQMRSSYGGWTTLLSGLGLLHVFTSIGFYVVTIALAISIVGCTTHRIPQLWQRWRHPRTLVSPRFFTVARYRAEVPTGQGAQDGLATASASLRAQHFRVIEAGENSLYADKFAWGGFGTVAAHLSFIVILGAFLISGLASYATQLDAPIGGKAVPVGDGTGLSVAVTDYHEAYDAATGQPTDYMSHVVVYQDGQQVAEQDVRVNSPLSYGKWTFYQYSGLGQAFDVRVTSTNGQTLFDGTVPAQYTSNDGTLSIGVVRIDSLGLDVQVEAPVSGQAGLGNSLGLAPGQAGFIIYADGADSPDNMADLASGAATVDQGGSYTHEDLTLTFVRESQYTGIKARTDPGTVFVWIGGILLVVGMTVTFTCRQRRLWLRAEDGRLLLASADKEDSGFRQHFTEVVEQAGTWYQTTTKTRE